MAYRPCKLQYDDNVILIRENTPAKIFKGTICSIEYISYNEKLLILVTSGGEREEVMREQVRKMQK